MRRYIFIGSVEYSAHCLRALLDMSLNIISIMCPYKEAAEFNSDYFDLKEVARYFGRDVYYFENIKQETDYIRRHSPDIVLVLGLS